MPYIVIGEIVRPRADAEEEAWKHEARPFGHVFKAKEVYQSTDGQLWLRADEYGTTSYPECWYLYLVNRYKDADGNWTGGVNAGWVEPVTNEPPPPDADPVDYVELLDALEVVKKWLLTPD